MSTENSASYPRQIIVAWTVVSLAMMVFGIRSIDYFVVAMIGVVAIYASVGLWVPWCMKNVSCEWV